jgi:hypothetical protein
VPEPLDPQRIFTVLERHGVDYVLIGGLAAVLHGSALVTNDADICPRRTPENLERLAAALRALDARLRTRGDPQGVEFACDASFLGGVNLLNLETSAGQFDIAFSPAGFDGYDALAASADAYEIDGTRVQVAALRDVIHSKETANRLKDQAALPHLYALEDEIAAEASGGAPGGVRES